VYLGAPPLLWTAPVVAPCCWLASTLRGVDLLSDRERWRLSFSTWLCRLQEEPRGMPYHRLIRDGYVTRQLTSRARDWTAFLLFYSTSCLF
jgi:hypothetical protein